MPNAKVGAMPQQNSYQNNYPPGRGTWRNRAQQGGGLTIEDLKRQTALRLAQEGGENSEADTSHQTYQQQQQQGNRHPQAHHPSSSVPHHQYGNNMAPNGNQYNQQPDYAQHHTTTYPSQHHYPSSQQHHASSRNYTDSQLGVGGVGRGGGHSGSGGQPQQQYHPPMRSPVHHPQQQYGTPRVPNHELALKDRGSAENSDASEGGYIVSKGSYGSNQSNQHRADERHVKQKGRGMQSPDGRRTPVRDGNVQGQKIIFSPGRRDHTSTPTSVYSEPPRNRSNPNSPHNMQRSSGMRSHNHQGGYRSRTKGSGGNYRHGGGAQQSKLPHGLTVQELKEMTRARLAADAEAAEVSSVHSGGTHGSSNNGSIYANVIPSQSSEPLTRNLVQTNDSIRHTQSFGGQPSQHHYQQHPQQQRQYQQYPNNVRHPSPIFGGAPPPNQFNGTMLSPRRSNVMSDYHQGPDGMSLTNSNSGGMNMSFSPPPMMGGPMVNRSRCHSAEATHFRGSVGSYNNQAPINSDANRRRCLTMSPLASRGRMDRVNEDTPIWFDDDSKDRLAVPSLSVSHGLQPPSFSESAFQPIGKASPASLSLASQKPQPLSHADRMLSMESQGHGDLPSSMAESVLNSLTGAPPGISSIGGDVIVGSSPFRPVKSQSNIGERPYRAMSDNFLTGSISGSESMFSNNGETNLGLLETHSWCIDGGDDDASNTLSLSHDFSQLLNMGEPSSLAPMRGRANTDPHFRWK